MGTTGADERPDHDMNVLHETRAAMRGSLLVDGPRTELVLVRHAQQSFAATDRAAAGAAGPPLSATGVHQAKVTAEHLAHEPITALYSSALTRAVSTAELVAAAMTVGQKLQVRPDLKEIELLSRPGDHPRSTTFRDAREFMHTRSFDSIPDTEPSAQARERMHRELSSIVDAHPGENVCVVSHGGAISTFLATLLGSDQDMFFFAAHASVTRVFHRDGRWAIHTVNEVDHLRPHGLVTF